VGTARFGPLEWATPPPCVGWEDSGRNQAELWRESARPILEWPRSARTGAYATRKRPTRGASFLRILALAALRAATGGVAAQPRTPRVPTGVFTLKSPLFCGPVINRSVPREASIAMLPVPLFGS
jgi:hypothetical protein